MISYKVTGRLISKDLASKYLNQIQREMKKFGEEGVKVMKDRTLSGRNNKGQFFPGYVPSYRAVRARRGLQVAPPNLYFTGKMLSSLKFRVERKGNYIAAVFRVYDNEGKVRGVSKKRPFLGLSKEATQIFRRIFQRLSLKEANK